MRSFFTLRRILIAAAIVILLPVVFVAGVVLFIESPSGSQFVASRWGAMIHREVELGDIDVDLGWPVGFNVTKLRISNPEWAERKDFINAETVYAQLEMPPLLHGYFEFPYIGARAAALGIERKGEQRTWRFGDGQRKPSRAHIGRVFMADGDVGYRYVDQKTALDFKVSGALGEKDDVNWTMKGTFKEQATTGEGRIAHLEPVFRKPIPLVGKARVGRTDMTVDGTIAPDLNHMDFKFTIAGQTLNDLDKIFGVNLPNTPPFKLAGHLDRAEERWVFEGFDGHVGDSDLQGTIKYTKGKPRPLLEANLTSKVLDLDDLGTVVGTPPKTGPGQTASPEQVAQAAEHRAVDRVLPRMSFQTTRWKDMDADVRLTAKQLRRPKQLAFEGFTTHLVLKDSVMKLDPFNFGFAGGKVASAINVDARKKPSQGSIDIDAQGLQLSKLFPTSETMKAALGTLYGHGKLAGQGESVGDLLATADGQLAVAVDGGRVSSLLVELLGLDFGEALVVLGTKNSQVGLRCAAGTFKIEDGRAEPENFVVDTTDTVVKVQGSVNLGTEKIDLLARPEPKDPSIFAMRSPIIVQGSFKHPKVSPKPGPLVARVVAAGALAAVAPPLAALAFVETGPGKDSDCGKVLADARAAGAVKKGPAEARAPDSVKKAPG
ncbi:hypothetical protein DSM104443_01154 [Usitatibacter rugosus]|uniref:AsmA domain-containing protein n=1 Tax=Usitatibacter rugosus TaxID=2732067 RepID=A0A6M4GSM7_9PROT|nr:AsmA family protein [Usitatibacter rugosus]QJR10102.1 hypothetical protein DSM104443_01154 [Usitatibacter rugosus]